MLHRARTAALILAAGLATGILTMSSVAGLGQASAYKGPRTSDGQPDLTGVWQAMGTAHYELEAHQAKASPVLALGALGAIPAGLGVVEGGRIPYRPEALAKKEENAANALTADPAIKCYMPGIPRATYMPFPFQIVQQQSAILMAYEFAAAARVIDMTGPATDPIPAWMGYSSGRWDRDTLVVDVKGFTDQTWFDRAGNFHSEALHVTERYTPVSTDVLTYEATMEDPDVFTRPWKISIPLYRRLENNAQILEFKCVEFVEELLYGQLKKK